MWHARIVGLEDRYGRWVPTGCVELEAARDYIATYYRTKEVIEWLKM